MNHQPTTMPDHLPHPRLVATDDLLDELQDGEANLSDYAGDWMEDCRSITIRQSNRAFVFPHHLKPQPNPDSYS